MNARYFAIPVIVLGSVLLASACTVSGSGSLAGGATVDVVCVADGAACVHDDDCCNFVCAAGVCDASQTCTLDNDPCSADSDCCSGACAGDGLCGLPTTVVSACAADGDACGDDIDCCNYNCAGGVCDSSQTCTLDNDPCSADSDCCTGYCASDGNCGLE